MSSKILSIGAGKMGGAIISGIIASGVIAGEDIAVIKPTSGAGSSLATLGVRFYKSFTELPDECYDFVIWAVKPQILRDMLDLAATYKHHIAGAIHISMVAGKPSDIFLQKLGRNTKLARIMPNLMVSIGRGTILYYNVLGAKSVEIMLQPLGNVVVLKNEIMIDRLTAIFGSGPAYLFLLADILVQKAVSCGLDEAEAKRVTLSMLSSSADYANMAEIGELHDLINSVASKKGVTEAALFHFEQNGLATIIGDGISLATMRAEELCHALS